MPAWTSITGSPAPRTVYATAIPSSCARSEWIIFVSPHATEGLSSPLEDRLDDDDAVSCLFVAQTQPELGGSCSISPMAVARFVAAEGADRWPDPGPEQDVRPE